MEGYGRDFLPKLTDADLSRVVQFSFAGSESYSMTVAQILRHAAIHSVHHRGQAALLCRMLGHAPGSFDALFFSADDAALS